MKKLGRPKVIQKCAPLLIKFDHAQLKKLKAKCKTENKTMAQVIRELVSNFLTD
jgi:hypothetical protein